MSTTSRQYRAETAPSRAGTSGSSSATTTNSVVAARVTRLSKRSSRRGAGESADARPQQLSLIFEPATPPRPAAVAKTDILPEMAARFANMDQRMTTADVLRVVGVDRSTIFRWVKRGIFPSRHASGGWLRSEVETWLAEKRASPP
jgi:predicted DNA-binding transcriptional regulator AlpA